MLIDCPRKSLVASFAAMTHWIGQTIVLACALKCRAPLFPVVACSTSVISTSWAFKLQALVSQVCKAASWSSVHPFKNKYIHFTS